MVATLISTGLSKGKHLFESLHPSLDALGNRLEVIRGTNVPPFFGSAQCPSDRSAVATGDRRANGRAPRG